MQQVDLQKIYFSGETFDLFLFRLSRQRATGGNHEGAS
jgi:hypothetical protein